MKEGIKMKIKFNLDRVQYSNKPKEQAEIKKLRVRLCSSKSIVETEPEALLQAVERGQSFTPAVMTGTKGDTWQSQQIIVADIDNDKEDKSCISRPMTPDTANMLCSFYDIDPYCMYYSFSNTEDHPKFRIIIILDEPLTNAAEAKDLTERFTALFNSYTQEQCADTTMADNARLLFGSRKGSVFYRGNVTPLEIMRQLPTAHAQTVPEDNSTVNHTQNVTNATQRTSDGHSVSKQFDLLECLQFISPNLRYEDWVKVGMCLKTEGYSWQDWDMWSSPGTTYTPGLCEEKWLTFDTNRKTVNGGFIVNLAKEGGYIPPKDRIKSQVTSGTVSKQIKSAVPEPSEPEYKGLSKMETPSGIQDMQSVSQIEAAQVPGYQNGSRDVDMQSVSQIETEQVPEPTDRDAPPQKEKQQTPPPEPTSQEIFDEFLSEISSERFKPISTEIPQLDAALQGGLERRTLVTLAAAPGAGKTAIAQYILENMAWHGHSIVYVNLEMDRSQLLSRSISRISHKYKLNGILSEDITALQVKRGYQWTDEQRKIVDWVSKTYSQYVLPNFRYVTTNPENLGSIDNTLSDILSKLEKITAELKEQGKEAPIVCIDYLQFIEYDMYEDGQRKPDNAEAIKQTLKMFKQFAMKHNTVVLMITANNRASNSEGKASMDSGRDTSNIEYSGDVMLSLVYTAVEEGWLHNSGKHDKNGNDIPKEIDNEFINYVIDYSMRVKEDKEYPIIAKLLSLKVVKGRSIKSRGVAKFVFDGRYFYYEPDENKYHNPYWSEAVADPE